MRVSFYYNLLFSTVLLSLSRFSLGVFVFTNRVLKRTKKNRCSSSRKGSVNYLLAECNPSFHFVCPRNQSTWVLIFTNRSQVRVQISSTRNAHTIACNCIEREQNSRIMERLVCRSATRRKRLLSRWHETFKGRENAMEIVDPLTSTLFRVAHESTYLNTYHRKFLWIHYY